MIIKQSLRNWPGRHKHAAFWIATVFGVGMLRPAPGTWGSLIGLLAGFGMVSLGVDGIEMIAWVAALTILSSKLINIIEVEAGFHDAPEIVIDEVAGQWMALLPIIPLAPHWGLYLLAFLLFRLFDILKPWPIIWLDRRVGGGFGVMVDDLLAGLMAAAALWILLSIGFLNWMM
jgi:phosphatidylglycerophosphatase A